MNRKMEWAQLVSDKRFGMEHTHDPKKNAIRTDFRRDYDRLVFSSPFRRLQNKTQVFPLPGSIFVHNRLTHSLEVSCVGKSMADRIGLELRRKYAGADWLEAFDHLGDIVAAACLAHDLGNPPFGHSGEKAISSYFSEGPGRELAGKLTAAQWADLTSFEGNANAFRVLTHQFNGRREGGFAMTYSTLASIVKYPYESLLAGSKGKFGFFQSERDSYQCVADDLGIIRLSGDGEPLRYARHPLVYIVEAADDICYEVMDIEDAHKLRILSTDEVKRLMMNFFEPDHHAHLEQVMSTVDDPNEQIAYLRSCVIGTLVSRCAEAFLEAEESILRGEFDGRLLSVINRRERQAYERCNALSWEKIYCASDVVDIELAGNRIITFLLDKMVSAVCHPELNYSRLLLAKVPLQYDVKSANLYDRLQAVVDHVSAMTDVYALDLYRKLTGSTLPLI